MSVLVKGWQMPRDCKHCKIAFYDEVYGTICPFNGIAFEADRKRQETCPLVEVPVRHGKWNIEISDDGHQATYRCSECGHRFKWVYDQHFPPVFNYCQKCGSRMDKE